MKICKGCGGLFENPTTVCPICGCTLESVTEPEKPVETIEKKKMGTIRTLITGIIDFIRKRS